MGIPGVRKVGPSGGINVPFQYFQFFPSRQSKNCSSLLRAVQTWLHDLLWQL